MKRYKEPKPRKIKSEGFGYYEQEAAHHYRVVVPRDPAGAVEIHEYVADDPTSPQPLATIAREHWELVSDAVRVRFNVRLKKHGYRVGRWAQETKVQRLLGCELLVLAFALDGATRDEVSLALGEWHNYEQEELWWFSARSPRTGTRGPATPREDRWRRAIRVAFIGR